jgi:hypothetical protein
MLGEGMELGSIGDTIAVEMALLERRFQCVKFPDQVYGLRDPEPYFHTAEEFGEIAEAINEQRPDIDVLEEIIQVGALCLAWAGDVLKNDPHLTQKLRGRLLAKTHALAVERSQGKKKIIWLSGSV